MNKEINELKAALSHKKNVIFDLDATIILLQLPWEHWKSDVIDLLGEEFVAQKNHYLATSGHPWHEHLNQKISNDQSIYPVFIQLNSQFEDRHFKMDTYVGMIDLIGSLNDSLILHLWTSNSAATAKRALEAIGLTDRFKTIVARDDVLLSKPEIDGWDVIAEGKQQNLDDWLFVGDSSNDSKAAAKIGMEYFQINYFKK
jgi:HAD superfamily hydrolase (TIGR01549 family)